MRSMTLPVDPIAFRAWLACLVFLFLKMMLNTLAQGTAKIRDHVATLPEDARYLGAKNQPASREEDSDLYQRGADCWVNDLENIPIFLFLSLGYVLAGGDATRAQLYFAIFCVARLAHTISFLKAWQPHRAIAYTVAIAVSAALAIELAAKLWLGWLS